MISDALVKESNGVLQIFSSRYKRGRPLIAIRLEYKDRPVKLITSWSDLTIKSPITVNGSTTRLESKDIKLTHGMIITLNNDNNVYIVMPEAFVNV